MRLDEIFKDEDNVEFIRLRNKARMAHGLEDFLHRAIPPELKAREPRNHYVAYMNGQPFAAFGDDRLEKYRASGHEIKVRKPSWQAKKKWAVYQELVSQYTEFYRKLEADDLISHKAIEEHPSSVVQYVARAIGADRWTRPDPRVGTFEPGFGGGDELFIRDQNGRIINIVFLGMSLEGSRYAPTVYMDQIAILYKGSNLGSRIMEALHRFCIENRCRLVIYKVTNPQFYDHFPWLVRDPQSKDYIFDPFSSKA